MLSPKGYFQKESKYSTQLASLEVGGCTSKLKEAGILCGRYIVNPQL